MAAGLAGSSTAQAAKGPVYTDPPRYKGINKAPATQAPPAPKPPPPFSLSPKGSFPDVLVDDAGTAHVVWNEDRGDAADVVVYCRILRGASTCAPRTDLRSEIPDSDPNARYDGGGAPHIVQVGDQLLVFSKRYPVVRDKPDGASSHTVLAWTSGNGGTDWTPTPKIVGKRNIDRMVAFGGEEDPAVLALGQDPFCRAEAEAGMCMQVYRSGQYAAEEGNLATTRDQNYYMDLVLDEKGMPVASSESLAYDTYVRRWTGQGNILDASTWTAPAVIPQDQTTMAGGPAGVFLMGKPKAGGAFGVARLNQSGATYTVGPQRKVSPDSGANLARLFQGADGRLFAAWQQFGKGLLLKQTGGAAGANPSFGAAKTVIDGDGNGQFSLSATSDGGGFLAYNHTGGIVGEGEIQAAGFGNQLSTGKKGIADTAGGGVTPGGAGTGGSCSELSFGAFEAEAVGGCLLKGKGARASEYVTSGEINMWGVRIVPDAGAKIVIDPKKLTLNTTGDVRVIVSAPVVGDIVLFHGRIERDLSKVVPGTNLFEFPTGLFKANILGFDVGSDINVRLEKDGVHIPVDLKLPAAFGGFSGHAELVSDREAGLHIDSVHIHIGPVPLGALIINAIDLDYAGGEDLWTGSGSVTVPAGGTLDLMAQFQMGNFKSASFSFKPGTPIPIGPFVYLLQFGGGLKLEPTTINANATLGAGVAVAGEAPIKVHGDFTMTFPSVGPADFRLKGTVAVFMFEIADGELNFQTDGYAAFRGHAGVELGPLEIDVNMDGFVDAPSGQYGASLDGKVDICVEVDVELDTIRVCGGATAGAAVSSKGFAACARINPPDPVGGFEVGLTYPWSDWEPVFFVNPFAFGVSLLSHIGGCHVEDYKIAPTRARAAQAGGGQVVTVPGGLPHQTLLVQGDGGPPKVDVAGPGTQRAAVTYSVPGTNATYVQLDKPAAGAWTVTPRAGSPAIKQIMTADGYVPAKVTGKLGGNGRARTIAYKITNAGHGQRVVFQESGAFGSHILGAAKGTKGTLRFRPADTNGGRRVVEALVQRDGLTTDTIRLGTYVAPGPEKPGKVRKLKASRRANNVVVRWKPTRGAVRYAVTLKGVKGSRLGKLVAGKTRKLTFAAIRREEKVTVTVRALNAKLRFGPAKRVVLRAKR